MKLLIASSLLLSTLWSLAQPQSIEQVVTKDKIQAHIGFLASDALRGRDTGSPELQIAAEYAKALFRSIGVRAFEKYPDYFQPVPLTEQSAPESGSIDIGGTSLSLGTDALLVAGGDIELTADIVYVNYGEPADFEAKDLTGKVVVALCGAPGVSNPREWFGISRDKRARAETAGAVALIELYNSTGIPWSLLTRFLGRTRVSIDDGGSDLLSIWVNDSNNEKIELFRGEDATASMKIEGAISRSIASQNVVGYIEGTDPELKDEYIVYSAHYDHVGVGRPDDEGDSIYNGARDNAVGTVTVLSMAEYFAQHPPKRSALFILFTAEEKGLLGSRHYVENSPVSLDQIVYCFNSDNGGYNDTSLATIIGLDRTTARDEIVEACETFGLQAIEDPAKEQGLFDRSDNVNFAAKGIPAPTFSLGFTAFDEEIGKYYHRPGDDPESLDYEYLLKFFRAYVYSGLLIADREDRPFWVEGDKYHEAGMNLYNGQ